MKGSENSQLNVIGAYTQREPTIIGAKFSKKVMMHLGRWPVLRLG